MNCWHQSQPSWTNSPISDMPTRISYILSLPNIIEHNKIVSTPTCSETNAKHATSPSKKNPSIVISLKTTSKNRTRKPSSRKRMNLDSDAYIRTPAGPKFVSSYNTVRSDWIDWGIPPCGCSPRPTSRNWNKCQHSPKRKNDPQGRSVGVKRQSMWCSILARARLPSPPPRGEPLPWMSEDDLVLTAYVHTFITVAVSISRTEIFRLECRYLSCRYMIILSHGP